MQQFAALPYRVNNDGVIQVLLVTSRGRGRWIVPKGKPIRGLLPHEAAAREAFEEAGVEGKISSTSLGQFRYGKTRRALSEAEIEVLVFPMKVTAIFNVWPEKNQRRRKWIAPIAASHIVEDAGLKRILQLFHLAAQTDARNL